ncbi:MAG: hypothetical protein NTW50_04755 [Candidatus Berkelbacteria bacterium]|nr:hypothetical protein [Candidatus Berkelbacteria bacterium]
MKYSCQNLTKSIKTISQLKPGLDLVLDQEKPNIKKGLESQTRIIEIVKQYTLIVQLGVKTYNYLVKKIGSHEELEKRVSSLKIGGNTAKQNFKNIAKTPKIFKLYV